MRAVRSVKKHHQSENLNSPQKRKGKARKERPPSSYRTEKVETEERERFLKALQRSKTNFPSDKS
jgi:hypothetical protein